MVDVKLEGLWMCVFTWCCRWNSSGSTLWRWMSRTCCRWMTSARRDWRSRWWTPTTAQGPSCFFSRVTLAQYSTQVSSWMLHWTMLVFHFLKVSYSFWLSAVAINLLLLCRWTMKAHSMVCFWWPTVGDFRYAPSMLRQPCLRNNINIDVLYLDNTNCDPTRVLPTRQRATLKIKEIIRSHPHHEVVIGNMPPKWDGNVFA